MKTNITILLNCLIKILFNINNMRIGVGESKNILNITNNLFLKHFKKKSI